MAMVQSAGWRPGNLMLLDLITGLWGARFTPLSGPARKTVPQAHPFALFGAPQFYFTVALTVCCHFCPAVFTM
jgi:hypothetical protein